MGNRVKKTHLRAIKRRLSCVKEAVSDIEHWREECEEGVLESLNEDIKRHFSIIKKHLDYLSNKF